MFPFLWRNKQTRAWAASLLRFVDYTQKHTHTPGTTHLDE